ncbi:MAG TPA: CopG family transcriptional regulator [Thermoanaerobaculia bacterium]
MNEDLFARLDSAARRSNTTQSEFMRKALREALNKITTLQREEQHRRGYAAYPVEKGEFNAWATEQVWPQ